MTTLNKIIIAFISTLFTSSVLAQEVADVSMADEMRASGKIYVVVAVLTIIFLGIALYLFLLDRKIGKLESESNTIK